METVRSDLNPSEKGRKKGASEFMNFLISGYIVWIFHHHHSHFDACSCYLYHFKNLHFLNDHRLFLYAPLFIFLLLVLVWFAFVLNSELNMQWIWRIVFYMWDVHVVQGYEMRIFCVVVSEIIHWKLDLFMFFGMLMREFA